MGGAELDEADVVARSRIGKVLRGKLRLDRLLGVGGTASVYAATHRTGKRYAVKVMHPQLMLNVSIRERFFREGYVVNRIEHPGVVAILDDDVDEDGVMFLVMELLEGEDIASLAARVGGRLAPGDVLFIAERALDVLAAAHALNVIHRDFKPENVFCTTGGGVKVLDFGIARLRELGRTSLTQPGSLMGTPAFMPPEQARGRVAEVDARSDIWAVGATMFTLLSGRHVFEGRTASELLLAAMCETAPPVRQILSSIPSDVAEIVDRALLPERDARWPDARTMQAAIRDALLDHPPEALASDFDPDRTENDSGWASVKVDPHVNPLGTTKSPSSRPPSRPRTLVDATFRHTIHLDESGVGAFLRRGVSRQASGDIEGAIDDYSRALELDRGCVVAYQNRGALRHALGDHANALTDYRTALQILPEDADLLFNTALTLQSLGDLGGARHAAEAAARIYGRSRERDDESRQAQALVTMLSAR
ncbi:MAG: serine/threonine-protein kinase [Labilithrix sp.]